MTEIKIDLERDSLFDELGKKRLSESYMLETEKSPQERFAFVSKKFGSNAEHAQRLYDYASKHWLSYSTPILSFGRTKNGLPISCFLNYMDDSANGLVDTLSEMEPGFRRHVPINFEHVFRSFRGAYPPLGLSTR